MKWDLSEIAGTVGMKATSDVDEPCSPKELGFECLTPIKGKLSFTNTGTLLLLKGDVSADVRLECGRCVTDYVQHVDAPIEEEFRIERVGDSMQVLPIDEDDITANLVTRNLIDVQELVRQNVLLALPIQPLCGEECKGLCPTCGENLNVRQCTCPPETVDSPFQALADLLHDEHEQ